MWRGLGVFEAIQAAFPDWFAVPFALLTQLGDVWFLAVLLSALYWIGRPNRDEIAVVGGVWLAGMGLYKGLKEVLGLPRPDRALLDPALLPRLVRPLYESTAFATGYGFPSGHAVNTTIVYFALAHVLALGTRRRRFGVAAAVVATVCFTRVALGVHFVADVVVGVAVGAVLLLGARSLSSRLPADRATVTFGLAIAFGSFFVAASDVHVDALVLLAAALGAFAGWQLSVLGRQLVVLQRPSDGLRAVGTRGGLAVAAGAPLVAALEYFPLVSAYAASGVAGLATAGVVTVPVVRHSAVARRVGVALRFWAETALAGGRHLLRPETRRQIRNGIRAYGARLRDWVRR